jgi:hypothetical protein
MITKNLKMVLFLVFISLVVVARNNFFLVARLQTEEVILPLKLAFIQVAF